MGDYAFEHNDLMKYLWTCMQCCERNYMSNQVKSSISKIKVSTTYRLKV